MKKLLALLLSVSMIISSFALTACGGEEQEQIDPNKTQINLAVASDGIGQEFYQYLKKEYEKKNPNVQIMIQNRHASLQNQERAVANLTDDIAVMSFSDYDNYGRYLMDITDLYSDKAYDENFNYVGKGKGTVSLNDRLDKDELVLLSTGELGKELSYKSIPFYSSMFGFWYDVDLFEDNGLYDLDGYKGIDGITGNADDGYGPDGKEGTFDDGLPSTFEDFKTLLLYMKDENVASRPFTWSSTEDWMPVFAMQHVEASYTGKNDYTITYTFDGEHSLAGTITPQTGWKLFEEKDGDLPYRQGEKAGVLLAEFIAKNELYSKDSLLGTQDNHAAQNDYLSSVLSNDRSAFLIEGSWWQYESRAIFNEMAEMDEKYGMGARKFSILPIPRFIGTAGIPDQINDKNIAPCSIGHKFVPLVTAERAGKREVIEDFLLFTNDNTVMKKFMEINSMLPTADVKASDSETSQWNYMIKSMLDYINDENTDVLYMREASARAAGKREYRKEFAGYFTYAPMGSKVNGDTVQNVLEEMCMKNNLTADSYWQGVIDLSGEMFNQEAWAGQGIGQN